MADYRWIESECNNLETAYNSIGKEVCMSNLLLFDHRVSIVEMDELNSEGVVDGITNRVVDGSTNQPTFIHQGAAIVLEYMNTLHSDAYLFGPPSGFVTNIPRPDIKGRSYSEGWRPIPFLPLE